MIFFPIICASLFIALPRIISAAPVSEGLVIDNNPSVGRTGEISPLLGLAWPGHYDEQSAWNEGETKSKDEESGNFEDNHQNPWRPQPIVQSMLQNNGDAVHIERTQGFNGVSDYQQPANDNNNNQPTGLEIEVEHPPQSGETEYNDDEENYDYYYAGDEKYINNPSSGETESEDKGSNYDSNSGININIKINNPKSE